VCKGHTLRPGREGKKRCGGVERKTGGGDRTLRRTKIRESPRKGRRKVKGCGKLLEDEKTIKQRSSSVKEMRNADIKSNERQRNQYLGIQKGEGFKRAAM